MFCLSRLKKRHLTENDEKKDKCIGCKKQLGIYVSDLDSTSSVHRRIYEPVQERQKSQTTPWMVADQARIRLVGFPSVKDTTCPLGLKPLFLREKPCTYA